MRKRLVGAFLSIIMMMIVVQDVPTFTYLDQMEHSQIFTSLERDAWRLADELDTEIFAGQIDTLQADLEAYAASAEPGARVVLVDRNGTVLMTSDGSDLGNDYTNRPEIVQALLGKPTTGDRQSVTLGDSLIYAAVPIEHNYGLIGAIRISYPGEQIDAVVSRRIQNLWTIGLLTVMVTVLTALLISNGISRRIRRIEQVSAAVANGNLSVQLRNPERESSIPEVRRLERTFDFMIERLKTSLDSQRSFASDASHQLRTPLTALRLKLENATEFVERPETLSLAAQSLDEAAIEVNRLQTMIDGLLALSRLEGTQPTLAPVNVDSVVHAKQELWQPLASEKFVEITMELSSHSMVQATELAVDQILDAYIENALDFAPENSTVTIRTSETDDSIVLEVVDHGPGLAPDDRERAFNRFWSGRPDNSGTGLGLAIVARLAETVGATVKLEATNPDGTGITAQAIFQKAE